MALGTAAILGLASAGGAVASGIASSKTAKAGERAANQADDTNRYIFDRNVELTEPQRALGNNAFAALAYEGGIGPRPTFGDSAGMGIREIAATGGQVPTYRPGGAEGDPIQTGFEAAPGSTPAQFLVGDQSFGTREDAQTFIDGQPSNAFEYTPLDRPDAQLDLSQNAFQASPGYQFRMDEGQKGLERMAAARGMRFSGPAAKDAMRFAQGLGSQEYGNFVGRQADQYNRSYGAYQDKMNSLRGLAGMGQQAAQSQVQAGQNYSNAAQRNAFSLGSAQAQGAIGMGNAITGGINSAANIYGMANSGYLGQNPGFGITPVANPFG